MWWLWTAPFAATMNPFLVSGESEAEQAELEEHVSALEEHGTQACCSWREQDGFHHFSKNWMKVTGVAPEKSLGAQLHEYLHPDTIQQFHEGIETLFHTDPQEQTDSYHMEARVKRHDGYWAWLDITMVPIKNHRERNVSLLIHDITEHKALETSVEQARQESDMANHGRSSFLSNMSHELRTPLNAILGFAQMLSTPSEMNEEQAQDYLRLIQESGFELLTKINDLIELSNIDNKCAALSEEPINIGDLIGAAIEMHSHQAFERNIGITKDIRTPHMVIRADRAKLLHTISHLITNAIKHSHPYSAITIQCDATRDQGIHIAIKDKGKGISQKHLGAIRSALDTQQSYYSTDIASLRLGLAIAKEFTELHGGKLLLESIEQCGTLASVILPPERIVSLSARVKPKKGATA